MVHVTDCVWTRPRVTPACWSVPLCLQIEWVRSKNARTHACVCVCFPTVLRRWGEGAECANRELVSFPSAYWCRSLGRPGTEAGSKQVGCPVCYP